MLVAAHVSSMKTRRSGSRSGWAARHCCRWAATSGRSCSAARRTFFYAQAQGGDRPPQSGEGDRQPQPVAEFLQGRVRGLGDGRPEWVSVGLPTWLGAGSGDARGDLAGLAAALLEAADPGLADAVLGGDGAGALAAVAVVE